MSNMFTKPPVGHQVEVVIDTADSHRKMAPCSKHRVGITTLLRGVVIESPKWCADHVCLINSDTRAHNYIPPHRILSINNQKFVQPAKTEDRVVTIKASKGHEKDLERALAKQYPDITFLPIGEASKFIVGGAGVGLAGRVLGWSPRYPTYREGLAALLATR